MSKLTGGDVPPRIVYLTDSHGDTTGHNSSVRDLFTRETLEKLPFDRSLHPVRAYIAAYGAHLVLLARLDFEYADSWHLNEAAEFPCKEAVAAYAHAATVAMRERATALGLDGHCAVPLPCSETEQGALVGYVAFDIEIVRDAKHAARLIRNVFGEMLTRPNYPTPRDDATALAAAYGGHWGEHPNHPVDDWKLAVAEGDTRQSYWDWVAGEARRCIEDAVADELSSMRSSRTPSP